MISGFLPEKMAYSGTGLDDDHPLARRCPNPANPTIERPLRGDGYANEHRESSSVSHPWHNAKLSN
jgi:hypothetical protein